MRLRGKLCFLKVFQWIFNIQVILRVSITKEVGRTDKAEMLCFKNAMNTSLWCGLELSFNLLNDWVEFIKLVF